MDMKVVDGLASLYAVVDHNPRKRIFTVKIRTKRQKLPAFTKNPKLYDETSGHRLIFRSPR